MVSVAVSTLGTTSIHFVEPVVTDNGWYYLYILKQKHLPDIRQLSVFQQDSAPAHIARETVGLLTDFISCTLWLPAKQPRLQFGGLQSVVSNAGEGLQSADEGRQRILTSWDELDQGVVDSAVILHSVAYVTSELFARVTGYRSEDMLTAFPGKISLNIASVSLINKRTTRDKHKCKENMCQASRMGTWQSWLSAEKLNYYRRLMAPLLTLSVCLLGEFNVQDWRPDHFVSSNCLHPRDVTRIKAGLNARLNLLVRISVDGWECSKHKNSITRRKTTIKQIHLWCHANHIRLTCYYCTFTGNS